MSEKRILAAYFSCSGSTKRAAETIASAVGAELFEIKPAVPYTSADLNWNDKKSRTSLEMNDKSSRPAIAEKCADMDKYDAVFVGFPIWWYTAPTIIDAFLESYDFSGKIIIPFATSGGSGISGAEGKLKALAPKAEWKKGRLLNSGVSESDIKVWVDTLGL